MDDLEIESRSLLSRVRLNAVTFFKYIVLCSGAIACYCLCYLAYEHDNHYCKYFSCDAEGKKHAQIPLAIVLFILASVASTFESISSTWRLLQGNRGQPNYARQFATAAPVTLFYLVSYYMFYYLPGVKIPCPWGPNNLYRNVKISPETYDCCITIGVIISGGIALFFQVLVTIIVGLAVESPGLKYRWIPVDDKDASRIRL